MSNQLVELKKTLMSEDMRKKIESCMAKTTDSKPFITSIMTLCSENEHLVKCNINDIIKEALKAASLNLPLSKALGYAHIVPYGGKPIFIIGYLGLQQLALRTGQYLFLNADAVYDGEDVVEDRLRGTLEIIGTQKSDKAIGYFAFLELKSGYKRAIYWTKAQVQSHAMKYSKAYNFKSSPWKTEFDEMAKKTMLRRLLYKSGLLTTEIDEALYNNVTHETINVKKYDEDAEIIDFDMNVSDEDLKETKKDTIKKEKHKKNDVFDGVQ